MRALLCALVALPLLSAIAFCDTTTKQTTPNAQRCQLLHKAISDAYNDFTSLREQSATNVFQSKAGWTTKFRLPDADYCFIYNRSIVALTCSYNTAPYTSVLTFVQHCLDIDPDDWEESSRKRFQGNSYDGDESISEPSAALESSSFINRSTLREVKVWQGGYTGGTIIEIRKSGID